MEKIQESKEICKEVLTILSCFDEEIISKMPDSILHELMYVAADSDVEYYIDIDKSLEEQDISEESKNLISLIYYSYIAEEEEKKELQDIWNKNEEKYQEENRIKYDIDKIFRDKKNLNNNDKVEMIEYKETIITRIINKIKRIFENTYKNKNS